MKKNLLSCLLLLLPGAALAHAGHLNGGLFVGLLHPFSGWDHLLAALTVGMSLGLNRSASAWKTTAIFLLALMAGMIAGQLLGANTLVEILILASVVLLGLNLLAGYDLDHPLGSILLALFALAHGMAHGAEAGYGQFTTLSGVVLGTLVLMLIGVGVGIQWQKHLLRTAGGLVMVAGLVMAF